MSAQESDPAKASDEQPTNAASNPSTPSASGHKKSGSSSSLRNADGWDGKLRVEKKHAVLVNPEVLDGISDPEDSDDDVVKVDKIEADEGIYLYVSFG